LAKTEYDQFENDIMYLMGECRNKIQDRTINALNDEISDNRITAMVNSGSKGSGGNIVQIVSLLGQQDISGTRIMDGYMRRPLPHMAKDDLSPETRGFVGNSYMSGLSPIEYIYHAMAGRLGVISTSIKTAETGYIQRKLVKVLEDLYTAYDKTIRNSSGFII